MRFPDWQTRTVVMDAFQKNPDYFIDNVKISLLPDLSTITLTKRQNLKFLTSVLQQERITYQWGFPFKLIVKYNKDRIIVRKTWRGREVIEADNK